MEVLGRLIVVSVVCVIVASGDAAVIPLAELQNGVPIRGKFVDRSTPHFYSLNASSVPQWAVASGGVVVHLTRTSDFERWDSAQLLCADSCNNRPHSSEAFVVIPSSGADDRIRKKVKKMKHRLHHHKKHGGGKRKRDDDHDHDHDDDGEDDPETMADEGRHSITLSGANDPLWESVVEVSAVGRFPSFDYTIELCDPQSCHYPCGKDDCSGRGSCEVPEDEEEDASTASHKCECDFGFHGRHCESGKMIDPDQWLRRIWKILVIVASVVVGIIILAIVVGVIICCCCIGVIASRRRPRAPNGYAQIPNQQPTTESPVDMPQVQRPQQAAVPLPPAPIVQQPVANAAPQAPAPAPSALPPSYWQLHSQQQQQQPAEIAVIPQLYPVLPPPESNKQ